MIRALRLAAAGALVAVAALSPGRAAAQQTVTCNSADYDRTLCRLDTRGGVELVRQLSDAPCVRGRSWGVVREGVWVSRGCRAQFRVGDDRRDRRGDERYDDRRRRRGDDRYDNRDRRRGELSSNRAAALCRSQIRRAHDVRNGDIRFVDGRRLRDGDYRLEWRARGRSGSCTVDARTGRVNLRHDRRRR